MSSNALHNSYNGQKQKSPYPENAGMWLRHHVCLSHAGTASLEVAAVSEGDGEVPLHIHHQGKIMKIYVHYESNLKNTCEIRECLPAKVI